MELKSDSFDIQHDDLPEKCRSFFLIAPNCKVIIKATNTTIKISVDCNLVKENIYGSTLICM